MQQAKIGSFLKQLRNEKGITQEQFAEAMNVSNRSVSRWENGKNMPDLSLLILIAEYYNVEPQELFKGAKKDKTMNKELKETVLDIADYSHDEKRRLAKKFNIIFIIGFIAQVASMLMAEFFDLNRTPLIGFIEGFLYGIPLGILIIGIIYTSKYMSKIKKFKSKLLNKDKH